MAMLTSANAIKVSGWSLMVGWENDFSTFVEDELNEMRKGAAGRMHLTIGHYLSEIKKTLSRVSPNGKHAAPGDPPFKITGDLIRTWKRGRTTWSMNRTVLTGRVESRHPAAGLFEFIGVRGTARTGIRPHPYVRITLARAGERMHDLLLGL